MIVRAWFKRYLLQLLVLVLVTASMYAVYPAFQVQSSLLQLIPLGVIAAGLAVTLIAGEFDLSIASMAELAGALTIVFSGLGLIVSALIATAICVLLGMLQGWLIARLGINSLVFTVGTLILFRGLTWVVCGGVAISDPDIEASDVFQSQILFFTPLSIVGLIVFIGLGVFLARTRSGRELHALGSARTEAIAAGVNPRRGLMLAFGISAGCGALGGALNSALSGSAAPDALDSMLITGLAAALIGGVSLAGGRGTMVNVFLGFAILAILGSGLALLGAPAFVAQLLTGLFLLVIVLAEHGIRTLAARGRRNQLRHEIEQTTVARVLV